MVFEPEPHTFATDPRVIESVSGLVDIFNHNNLNAIKNQCMQVTELCFPHWPFSDKITGIAIAAPQF